MHIIIAGPARTGTSMTSGLVDALGIPVITDVPQPYQLRWNPKGMFESWTKLGVMIRAGRCKSIAEAQKIYGVEASRLVSENGDTFGFKSLSLEGIPFMLRYLKEPKVIVTHREEKEYAKALTAFVVGQNSIMDEATAVRSSNTFYARFKKLELTCPVLHVWYGKVRANPIEEAEKMASFVGVGFDEERRVKVLEWVDSKMRTW